MKNVRRKPIKLPQDIAAQAYEMGKQAYHAGLMAAPACNAAFTQWMLDTIRGHEDSTRYSCEIMKVYSRAYTTENLAAPWE